MQETWLRWADRSTRRRCRTRARTWSASSPVSHSTGCARSPAGARSTSASGCPSRCSPAPTWPRTSSWPRACRSRCSPCWRRSTRPSARCSCCARSSTSRTTRSRRPWTSRRRRCARSRTGPGSTWPRDGRGCRSTAPSSRQVVERFLAAVDGGDVQGLLDVLAPDVVLRRRRRRSWCPPRCDPIGGAETGRAVLVELPPSRRADVTTMWLNGAPGGADRPRRRARHRDQPGGRGRPDHPDLRGPQPAQAGPARRAGAGQPPLQRRPGVRPARREGPDRLAGPVPDLRAVGERRGGVLDLSEPVGRLLVIAKFVQSIFRGQRRPSTLKIASPVIRVPDSSCR